MRAQESVAEKGDGIGYQQWHCHKYYPLLGPSLLLSLPCFSTSFSTLFHPISPPPWLTSTRAAAAFRWPSHTQWHIAFCDSHKTCCTAETQFWWRKSPVVLNECQQMHLHNSISYTKDGKVGYLPLVSVTVENGVELKESKSHQELVLLALPTLFKC